jgi:hypothetical protein
VLPDVEEGARFDGYLARPVDLVELLDAVEEHCGRR